MGKRKKKRSRRGKPTAIDLFCGCGGLSLGLRNAGFKIVAAVDADPLAVATYKQNHRSVNAVCSDIRKVVATDFQRRLKLRRGQLDLLAGCPPCQGFSRLRTMNGGRRVRDSQNNLLFQFLRFVRVLKPKAIMIENVPKLRRDRRYFVFVRKLKKLGYRASAKILNAKDYGVPQRRRRMILLAARGVKVEFAPPVRRVRSVGGAIRSLSHPRRSRDKAHNYAVLHTARVRERIRHVPRNGGGRIHLPKRLRLRCHQKNSGFRDIYGRMSWKEPSPTITGGCINPSKGRYLHPTHNRAITLREAALLQGFPRGYVFDLSRGRYPAAQLIGNAFPPRFAEHHARQVRSAIECT